MSPSPPALEPSATPSAPGAAQSLAMRVACAWAAFAGVAVYLGLASLAAFAADLPAAAQLWLALLPLHGAAFAAFLLTLRRHVPPGTLGQALNLASPLANLWADVARAGHYLVLAYPSAIVATLFAATLMRLSGFEPEDPIVIQMLQTESGIWFWASILLTTLVIAPLVEEILFRLGLYEWLRLHGLPHGLAMALTAASFAAIHQAPAAFPGLFILGLFMQHARRASGTLRLPILVHAGFNAISLAMFALALN